MTDRSWLVARVAPDTGNLTVVTAKPNAGAPLLQCRAELRPNGHVVVYVPSNPGRARSCRGKLLVRELAEYLGYPVELIRVGRFSPQLTNAGFYLPPVVGYDSSPLHIITDTSLKTLQGETTETAADTRRYRPNLVISAFDNRGWPEDTWVGRRLQIGDTLRLFVRKRTPRCKLPTQPQLELPALTPGRILEGVNDRHFGVYASVLEPGVIREGDQVTLLP